jgi:AcrR family transcriptional regulator
VTTVSIRGRPRNPEIDEVVLETTRRLLGEVGYSATTVQEISRRSGVHPPAIYRRWPSRRALIEDAAFSGLTEIRVEPSGDLRADLSAFLVAYERSLGAPAARAAMPGLLATYQDEVPLPAAHWLHLSVRPHFEAILHASVDEIDPGLDPDEVFDLIQGAVLGRIFVPAIAARGGDLDTMVEMVVRILTPPVRSQTNDVNAGGSHDDDRPRQRRHARPDP